MSHFHIGTTLMLCPFDAELIYRVPSTDCAVPHKRLVAIKGLELIKPQYFCIIKCISWFLKFLVVFILCEILSNPTAMPKLAI